MRSLLIWIKGFVIVSMIAVMVYYAYSSGSIVLLYNTNHQPLLMDQPRVVTDPVHNPLVRATYEEFTRWLPACCGTDIFVDIEPQPYVVDQCASGIITRVQQDTGIKLTIDDILNSLVKKRWLYVMGAK